MTTTTTTTTTLRVPLRQLLGLIGTRSYPATAAFDDFDAQDHTFLHVLAPWFDALALDSAGIL